MNLARYLDGVAVAFPHYLDVDALFTVDVDNPRRVVLLLLHVGYILETDHEVIPRTARSDGFNDQAFHLFDG